MYRKIRHPYRPVLGDPSVFTIFDEDFDLMGDAVAVFLVLVIAGEADVKGYDFFNKPTVRRICAPYFHNII